MLALVAGLALAPYLAMPSQPLVYDAPATVLRNDAVQRGSLADLFRTDFWGNPLRADYSTGSYRPLVSLTYLLQVRWSGNSPAAFHLFDMALHALCALLVTLLAGALGLRRAAAVVVGALFALHPVQSEAVCSVVGRADMMAAALFLGSVLLHLKAWEGWRRWAGDLAALTLLGSSMMCKEYAVAFPFVLIGIDLARTRFGGRRPLAGLPFWIASLTVLAGYLFLRFRLLGSLGGVPMLDPSEHPLAQAPWLSRWSTAARLLALSGRLFVLPVHLNHHYRLGTLPTLDSPFHLLAVVGIVFVVGWLAIGIVATRKERSCVPLCGWLLCFLPLAPGLNLFTLGGVLFAERYLYLPTAGFALLVAWSLEWLPVTSRSRRAALAAVGVLALAGGVVTVRRVGDWGSDERLARSSIASYPNGSEVWRDLGLALGSQGRRLESIEALEHSLKLEPGSPRTWQAYATALFEVGRYTDGAEAWRHCYELMPNDPAIATLYGRALLGSASALRRAGDPAGAESLVRRAVALDALPADDLFEAGRIVAVDQAELAEDCFSRALSKDPDLLRRRHAAAVALEREGRLDEAAALYREILLVRPDHAATLFNLGRVLLRSGRRAEAAATLRRGLAIEPDPRARALLERAQTPAGAGE